MIQFNGECYITGTGGVTNQVHQHRYLRTRGIAHQLNVMDVACGEGYLNILLAVGISVIGIDILQDAVEHASNQYCANNLRFLRSDCVSMSIESVSIDLIIDSFETIEYHDQQEVMQWEISCVQPLGGVLIVFSSNKLFSKPKEIHIRELEFSEFDSFLSTHFINPTIEVRQTLS